MRDTSLEEHRVCSELSVEQWHVTVDPYEEVDALVSFIEVRFLDRQSLRAARTSECPPRRHLHQHSTVTLIIDTLYCYDLKKCSTLIGWTKSRVSFNNHMLPVTHHSASRKFESSHMALSAAENTECPWPADVYVYFINANILWKFFLFIFFIFPVQQPNLI